jgi:kynureninase
VHDPLLAWRAEFPILETSTYLVSHSLGAMPRGVSRALAEYAEAWATRGVRAWAEGWWDMPVSVGDLVAPLIGARPGTVAMHQNVSVCQSLVLSCLRPTAERNRIVCEASNFPSVLYVHQAHRASGVELVTVPSEDGITVPLDRLLEAIDERTLLVPLSHVIYRSGFVQDVAAVVRRAHEVGALVLADLYQSAGTVPVDVSGWDVDFATGGSVKWLCGGPGAGYLYVAPRLHGELQPQLTGWMAHAHPFAFESELDYAPGIRRFLHGSPAVPALYAARSGYEIVGRVGLPAIREKSVRQVAAVVERAREHGLLPRVAEKPAERSGMVIVDVPHGEAVTRELLRREVVVDHRPGAGIRLSPHFYTTDDEVLGAVDEIRRILDSGAWKAHEAHGGTGF